MSVVQNETRPAVSRLARELAVELARSRRITEYTIKRKRKLADEDLLPLTDEEVSGLLIVLDPFQCAK